MGQGICSDRRAIAASEAMPVLRKFVRHRPSVYSHPVPTVSWEGEKAHQLWLKRVPEYNSLQKSDSLVHHRPYVSVLEEIAEEIEKSVAKLENESEGRTNSICSGPNTAASKTLF